MKNIVFISKKFKKYRKCPALVRSSFSHGSDKRHHAGTYPMTIFCISWSLADFFNDVSRDSILRKAILFLLALGRWKETLDKASCVIYTDIVVETDYRAK